MNIYNKKPIFLLLILLSSIVFLSCQPQNELESIYNSEATQSLTKVVREEPMTSPAPTPEPTPTPEPEPTPSPIPSSPETQTPAVEIQGDVEIVVYKRTRRLELWQDSKLIGDYPIGLGFIPEGHKEIEGDGKTPEGNYYVCTRNDKSKYYLSLGVSYPSIVDAKRGLEAGLITSQEHDTIINAINSKKMPPWDTKLGGAIMIHGHGSHSDWTEGCIAVDDDIMDILWENCKLGVAITIYQ